jgi:hypothetical protein
VDAGASDPGREEREREIYDGAGLARARAGIMEGNMKQTEKKPGLKLKPEDIERVLTADLANVIKKVRSGKTLTGRERALLQQNEEHGKRPKPLAASAKNKSQLAAALGISRQLLNAYRKRENFPKAEANGTWIVQPCADWINANRVRMGKEDADGQGWTSRLLCARALREESELRVALVEEKLRADELVEWAAVHRVWSSLIVAMRQRMLGFANSLSVLSQEQRELVRSELLKLMQEMSQPVYEKRKQARQAEVQAAV